MNKGIILQLLILYGSLYFSFAQPLQLEKLGTEQVYFSYHGKPLLSFGGMSDFIFYAAEDAFDYKKWADWQKEHGMNHCRAYLPGSWVYVEKFAQENGGSVDNVLYPFQETEPGSRQFDLTKFDERYWQRFRKQCEYLESQGIIIDLLMWNGWQLSNYNETVARQDWNGHFFNPVNNINPCTNVLSTANDKEARLKIYHSFDDGNQALFDIQKAYYEKIIDVTHDLDNIYYELVHEIAINYSDWSKTSNWIETMAETVRNKWQEHNPDRPIILAIDGGHLAGYPFNQGGGYPETGSEMDWVFSRPYFDVIVDGNHHHTSNVREWVRKYQKPYIAQESRDDSGQTWSYRIPESRTHLRKYVWKMMLAKCQQIDIYTKPQPFFLPFKKRPGPSNNYDPNGWNAFEQDALLIRQFFDGLVDYGNLDHVGYFWISSVGHNLVLSSPNEIVAYISSPTGLENMDFGERGAHVFLYDLPFPDGEYAAHFFDPKSGPAGSKMIVIKEGVTKFRTSQFVDDMAVHIKH